MSTQYKEQTDIKNRQKIHEYCAELPPYIEAYMRSIAQRTSTTTQLGYVTDIRGFFIWMKDSNPLYKNTAVKDISTGDLGNLSAQDFEDYLISLDTHHKGCEEHITSNETKRRRLASVKGLFKYLYKMGDIEKNVTELVATPKLISKHKNNLDLDEAASMVGNMSDMTHKTKRQAVYAERDLLRDKTIILLFLMTGIRVSELVGINISDVNIEKTRIRVFRKEGRDEYVYFGDDLTNILQDYLTYRASLAAQEPHTDALFISDRGTRISTQTARRIVSRASEGISLDKKVTPHSLRRTYGTNLYRKTNDIYAVAECLGHKDITTTKEHYVNAGDDTKRRYRNAISYFE
jgi:site-specific recombinase XerD